MILVAVGASADAPRSSEVLLSLTAGYELKDTQIHSLSGSLSEPPNLHGFEVLASADVSSPESFEAALSEVVDDLEHPPNSFALCFIPHHALSFRSPSGLVDILICYECNYVRIYINSELISSGAIGNASESAMRQFFAEFGLGVSDVPSNPEENARANAS